MMTKISVFPVFLAGMVLIFSSFIANAQQANSRINGLGLSSKEPIQIESDRLDIDDDASSATFNGNVNVVQGDTLLKSGKMVVYYAGGGSVSAGATDIEKIEVSGSVVLQSGNQTATADSGLFNMVAQTLVLTGKKVVLSQGDNILVGCKLTVKMQTGDARINSCKNERVIFQIEPKSAQQ